LDGYKYNRRAIWATPSHSSVDRQRNDRLGRATSWYPFEHRRKILRVCTESDTHANIFSQPNRDSYPNRDRNDNSNANGNYDCYAYSDGNTYSDTNRDSYSNTERYRETQSDIPAAPDSGTATITADGRVHPVSPATTA
jgi:hypothetical protein